MTTVTSSPVQLDDGSAYELLVVNSGSVDVYVSRGQQSFKLKPGGNKTVEPEGAAVTAQVMGSTNGQVSTTVIASSNPESISIDGGTP